MQKSTAVVSFFVILAAIPALPSVAQPEPPRPAPAAPARPEPAELVRANEAFTREDWSAAVAAYNAAKAKGITSPFVDFRLGYSLHMLKRYDEALACHVRAAHINNPALRIDALYNAACAHAQLGHKAEALKFLALAVDAGFVDTKQLTADADLDSLRSDQAFKDLAASIGKAPRLHQQLDFLIGTWSSTDAAGKETESLTLARPLPTSHAIVTTSTNAGGGASTGLLAPNPAERTWSWVWVDAMGTRLEFIGTAIQPAGLQFIGRQITPAGPGTYVRLTMTPGPDGSVRQKAETSDDGSDWRPHHDTVFARKGPDR